MTRNSITNRASILGRLMALAGLGLLAANVAFAQVETTGSSMVTDAPSTVIEAGDRPVSISVDEAGAITIDQQAVTEGSVMVGAGADTAPETTAGPVLPHDLSA